MSKINFTVEEKENLYILRMRGDITTESLPEYRQVVDDLMKDLDVQNKKDLSFIVDYDGVGEVDSAAVANILERLTNAVRTDHRVVFINVPEKFSNLVDILQVGDSIKIYDSEQQAIEELRKIGEAEK